MPESAPANYIGEFLGTFLLVFTVGCNVSTGGKPDAVWGVTSIACVLMVAIYALAGVSGAHLNPAVSVALGFIKEMEWKEVAKYCAAQIAAGIAAGFCFVLMLHDPVNPAPKDTFGWWEAGLAEIIYTFVLCFVVLNCAVSKTNADKQFYGLAIGFVVIAGGYGAGAVSGGCFNPAVALGLDISSALRGFGWGLAYAGYEIIGAAVAAGLFKVVRPDHFDTSLELGKYDLLTRCVSEFLGTFVLVLTVGLNLNGDSKAGAWSIAAALMSMIFALGSCSGAHFNPAVTCAIVLAGRDKCSLKDGGAYIGSQLGGGILAAFTYSAMWHWKTQALGPKEGFTWLQACAAELVFTFVLCFVVLCVATVKNPLDQYFGLAIGSCVTVGGIAIGGISGGSLNPAVSVGISSSHILSGGKFFACLIYSAVELTAGAAAAGVFFATHPSEYPKESLIPLTAQSAKGGYGN